MLPECQSLRTSAEEISPIAVNQDEFVTFSRYPHRFFLCYESVEVVE